MKMNSKPKKNLKRMNSNNRKNIVTKLAGLLLILILASCNSQKKYSDFDYSYSRSGGYAPVYENLVIKGKNAHYSFEGQGKKTKKDFKVTDADLKMIEKALTDNRFRQIQEDHKKVYDNIATIIKVNVGPNSASKSDASFIMQKDMARWKNITDAFRSIINRNIKQQEMPSSEY